MDSNNTPSPRPDPEREPGRHATEGDAGAPQEKKVGNTASLMMSPDPADRAQGWRRFECKYGRLIYAFARGHGMQHDDAKDVVQEVALKVFDALAWRKYEERQTFRSWLYRVARFHLIDILRRKSRNGGSGGLGGTSHLQQILGLADRSEPSAYEKQVEAGEITRLADKEFEQAGDTTRRGFAAWRSHVVEDESVKNIAKAQGVHRSTVHRWIGRALLRLRRRFGRQVRGVEE